MSDKEEENILHVNDEIDLTSLLAVFLENFNFLLSILAGFYSCFSDLLSYFIRNLQDRFVN